MTDGPPRQIPGTPAQVCPRCEGTGRITDSHWPSGMDVCPRCDGRRVVARGRLREDA